MTSRFVHRYGAFFSQNGAFSRIGFEDEHEMTDPSAHNSEDKNIFNADK
jgi:hypothetical protein